MLPTAPTAAAGDEVGDKSVQDCADVEIPDGEVLTAEQLEQAMDACLIPEDREALSQGRSVDNESPAEEAAAEKAETAEAELDKPAMGLLAASALGWKFASSVKAKSRKLDRGELERLGQEASQKRFKRWDDIRFW